MDPRKDFAPIGLVLSIVAIVQSKANQTNRVLGIIATVISLIGIGILALIISALVSAAHTPIEKVTNTSQTSTTSITDAEARAAKSFFTYAAAKNYTAIYNNLTEPAFKQQTTEAQFTTGLSDPFLVTCLSLIAISASYPYNVVTNKDGGQTLYYKASTSNTTNTTRDNSDCDLHINLRKQSNGSWLLYKPAS